MRIATRLPSIAPTPLAARMIAQAPAPPSSALAISGPSTVHEPTQNMFEMPKMKTVDHSHVCDVNSRQPARSSWK